MATNAWAFAEAKAKLSEVGEQATRSGPQVITRHGKPRFVLLDIEEYQKLTKPKESLVEFFRNSPLRDVEIPRLGGRFRPAKF